MPLKKTVAAERRMDLASFFCMIGRHGPAVALAVVAVVTVLAGFYFYRTVTGRRRKAACADGAVSPGEVDRDASVIQESRHRSGESTDVRDEGSSDVMEDVGNLRRRPHRNPLTPTIQTPKQMPAAIFRAAQTPSEEADRSPPPPATDASRGEEVKESCVDSLQPRNREEHEEVLEDKRPDDEAVSSGGKTGTEENRQHSKISSGDGGPASLICSSKEEKMEKTGPEEEKETMEDEESQSEEEGQDNGPACDVEDQEAELKSEQRECSNMSVPAAEVSDKGSSLPWQRQKEDKTSKRVEVSKSFFTGPEIPETGNQPEPEAEQASCLPTPREPGSAPDEASSGLFPDPGVAPGDPSPPVDDIQLSFEQTQEKDDDEDASSAGVGAESGISSLAVSPDAKADGNIFSVNDGDSVTEGDPQTEAPNSLYADDVVTSVVNDQMTEVMIGSFQSCFSQMFHSESTNWTRHEAANEDTLGHEIEDSYHRLIDQFAAQIAVGVTSFPHQLTAGTHVRRSVQVIETREKTSIKEKEDSEMGVDYDRTEISIMEATMDNNEWITDNNSPVLPWLVHSPLDHPKTNQVPSGDVPPPSGDVPPPSGDVPPPSGDVPPPSGDVPPPSGGHQNGMFFTDENMEHYKKVVAVQPMPQNVSVTFRVHYYTQSPYQTVGVTGNQPELGNWTEFIPMEKVKEGHWTAVVILPTESHVEWKFVLLDKGEVCRWEECGNRLLDTGLGDDIVVHKWWGLV